MIDGLTVVDLATLAAAPQIAAFFGDLGARVVKVEPPGGDPLRRLVDDRGAALGWKIVNRNKECVTLDPTRPEGRALLDRLLERADLLVCAHSATRRRRLGIDEERLRALVPRLVVVNLTAWGEDGPWGERPGSGTLAEAAGGLAALTGEEGGPPGLSPVGLGDFLGVQQGIVAALLGLWTRDASSDGRGEGFDVAMLDPVLSLLGLRIAASVRAGKDPGRHGNRFPTMAPRNVYACADGRFVALTAGTDELVRRLFGLVGRPELADDPRFATNAARVANVDALDEIVGAWIAARPCAEVVDAFAAARVSLAAVDGPLDVAASSQVAARGGLVRVDDPEAGPIVVPATLPRGAARPAAIRHLGRALGADNDAVWGEWLGVPAAERAELARRGVI